MDELESSMSSRELMERMALQSVEPDVLERIEVTLAIGFATLAQLLGGKRNKIKPKQFLPWHKGPRVSDQDTIQAMFKAMAERGKGRK